MPHTHRAGAGDGAHTQLRVHMAAFGHPICGDPLYGTGEPSAERLLLHAAELTLLGQQFSAPALLAAAIEGGHAR